MDDKNDLPVVRQTDLRLARAVQSRAKLRADPHHAAIGYLIGDVLTFLDQVRDAALAEAGGGTVGIPQQYVPRMVHGLGLFTRLTALDRLWPAAADDPRPGRGWVKSRRTDTHAWPCRRRPAAGRGDDR